jgi:hypothetical protein
MTTEREMEMAYTVQQKVVTALRDTRDHDLADRLRDRRALAAIVRAVVVPAHATGFADANPLRCAQSHVCLTTR